ncbi:MAG: hypothetical protein HKO89_01615 [Saprospiraceae bacterium]|nr:hypothetical protein [Saprospiraceae bacterium]
MNEIKYKTNPIAGIIALVFIVFMIWLVFNFVKGLFSILSFLAIPLFILAVIFNYQVVGDYFKWIYTLFKKEPAKGLLAGAGTVIGYPVVAAYLFFKAFSNRKIAAKKEEKKPGEYIKFEEMEEDEDFLELPKIPGEKVIQKQSRDQNKYDDLFS